MTPTGTTRPAAVWTTVVLLSVSIATFATDPGKLLPDRNLLPESIILIGFPIALMGAVASFAIASSRSLTRADFLGGFVISLLLGAALGPDPVLSFWFVAAFAATGIATRRLARHSPDLALLSIASGLILFIVGFVVVKLLGADLPLTNQSRLTLVTLDANQLGRFAGAATLSGVYLVTDAKKLTIRLSSVGLLLVSGPTLLLTGSRTAVLAFAAALAVIIAFRGSKHLVVGVAGLVTLLILVMMTTPIGPLISRITIRSGANRSLSSFAGRTDVWPVVFDQISSRPIAGHGVGVDRSVSSSLSPQLGFEIEHAHNLLLHVGLTSGLLGVAAFIGLVLASLRRSSTSPKRSWVFGFWVFILVAGISEPVLQNPGSAWVLVVVTTVISEMAPPDSDSGAVRSEPKRLAEV